ncbi:MAG: hypothetical protein WD016_13985 [Balneolaceae bacterium]
MGTIPPAASILHSPEVNINLTGSILITKREIKALTLFISMLILFSACDYPTEPDGENYDLFHELELVEGAGDIQVTIKQGSAVGRDAYFEFDIDNLTDNPFIAPGTYEGWCIEWTKPIAQNGDVHQNLKMYSTFGKEKYKSLNYFLNIKEKLKSEDPELTFKEFQAVIWTITEGPEFDLNSLADEKLPPRLLKNGTPDFSKEKVLAIVENVRANASAFEYNSNSTYALFISTNEQEQDVMVPTDPPAETVSHGYLEGVTPENVAPEMAERTYPVIQANWNGPGGDSRWLARNLGATEDPNSLTDGWPESAGWYFQFNFRQGLFPTLGNDEVVENHVPGDNTGSQNSELDSDWIENDPCALLLEGNWRIPTEAEWESVIQAGAASALNLHTGGYILGNISFLTQRGSQGLYWSSTQTTGANNGSFVTFSNEAHLSISSMLMWSGLPLRCIED